MNCSLPSDQFFARPNALRVAILKHASQLLIVLVFMAALLIVSCSVWAQPAGNNQSGAYYKEIQERSAKIVNTLAITDSPTYKHVLNTIANQYISLRDVYDQYKRSVATAKSQYPDGKIPEALQQEFDKRKQEQLTNLHNDYLSQLAKQLNAGQIEKVKDGMTYGVFPNTYRAYQDMIQTLTEEEKQAIYNWLKEAREIAMDAESSEAKHAVFGKYKGRINNYLSLHGYDLKKETEAWQQRLKQTNNPQSSK